MDNNNSGSLPDDTPPPPAPASIPNADHPWQFNAVIEGELVHIDATFDHAGVERFRSILIALRSILDAPTVSTGSIHESAVPKESAQSQALEPPPSQQGAD